MNILITGATGYVGRFLVNALLEEKYTLCLIVRNKVKACNIFDFKKNITILSFDDLTIDRLEKFKPEVCFNLMGYSTSSDQASDALLLIEANITRATLLLAKLKKIETLKYFINIGSSTEYYNNSDKLNPTYLYSATKSAFKNILEYYTKSMNLSSIHVVLYSVYGVGFTHKRIIDYLLSSQDSSTKIDLSPGMQKIDFIHVFDVISFFLKLLSNLDIYEKGKVITEYLGTGDSNSLRQVASLIEFHTGKKLNVNWGGRPYRERDNMHSRAPSDRNRLIWKSQISISQGIKLMVNSNK